MPWITGLDTGPVNRLWCGRVTLARGLQIPGLRPIEKRDVPSACRLLNNYLRQFQLAPVLDQDDFEYIFLTRPGVIYTYVRNPPLVWCSSMGRLKDVSCMPSRGVF